MKQLLLITFLLASFLSQAQQIVWEQIWGDTNTHMGHEILLTKRNTVIVNALSDGVPAIAGRYPITFLEYDLNGNLLGQKPGSKLAFGEQDLIQLPDSSFLFGGCQVEFGSPFAVDSEAFLQKLSSNGDTLWKMLYPSVGNLDYVTQLLALDSGHVLIAGMGRIQVPPYLSYFNLRKVDSSGNVIWYREYAPNLNAYGSRVLRNRRGNLIMAGYSDRPSLQGQPMFHPYFLEVNTYGDSIRSNAIVVRDTAEAEVVRSGFNNIIETKDGNYVVTGFYSDSGNYSMGYILKLDTTLNVLWKYTYRSPSIHSRLFKVHELADSSLYILILDILPNRYGVIKLNPEGEFIGKQVFQPSICNTPLPFDWEVLNDTSFVVVGQCNPSGFVYIAKVDFPKILGSEESVIRPQKQQLGLAYPNPANTLVTIGYELAAEATQAQITFYDIVKGTTVETVRLGADQGKGALQVDLNSFANGLYAYTLTVDGKPVATHKLTVIK